jgi:hypothetical protein
MSGKGKGGMSFSFRVSVCVRVLVCIYLLLVDSIHISRYLPSILPSLLVYSRSWRKEVNN